MYDWLYYSQVAHGYMCKICEVFYGKSPVSTGRGRGTWSHAAVIFHGNAGKKLRSYAKSKPHTDAILVITSTRLIKPCRVLVVFRRKQISMKCMFWNWSRLSTFWENNLPIKELYAALMHFLAFDLEEPVTKQYLENCPGNATYDSHTTADSLISALNKTQECFWCSNICWWSYKCC